jgi:hypothetical protein
MTTWEFTEVEQLFTIVERACRRWERTMKLKHRTRQAVCGLIAVVTFAVVWGIAFAPPSGVPRHGAFAIVLRIAWAILWLWLWLGNPRLQAMGTKLQAWANECDLFGFMNHDLGFRRLWLDHARACRLDPCSTCDIARREASRLRQEIERRTHTASTTKLRSRST